MEMTRFRLDSKQFEPVHFSSSIILTFVNVASRKDGLALAPATYKKHSFGRHLTYRGRTASIKKVLRPSSLLSRRNGRPPR